MGNLIVSIGDFNREELAEKLSDHNLDRLILYEPNPLVYETYIGLSDKLTVIEKAVRAEPGHCRLFVIERKESPGDLSPTSTAYKGQVLDLNYKLRRVIDVACVSLSAVLSTWREVDELYIDCEGEEISLIQETPIELFKRCKFIEVSFHAFVAFHGITTEQISDCCMRLRQYFDECDLMPADFTHKFVRKDNV